MAEIRSRERRRNSLKPTFWEAVLRGVQVRRACPAGFCSAAARRQPADMIVGLARALSRAARATQPCPPLLTCPRTALSPPSLTLAGEKEAVPDYVLSNRGHRLQPKASLHGARDALRRQRAAQGAMGSMQHSRRIGREGRRRGMRGSNVAQRCRGRFSLAHVICMRSPEPRNSSVAVHGAHAVCTYRVRVLLLNCAP